MRTTIDLPDSIYHSVEHAARSQGVTVEQLIVRAFERELNVRANHTSSGSRRVALPLLCSKEPGTLDLTGFDFDDLLA